MWPSLDKYLGHLFVVQKASPDQHATATGHLCPVAKNALTRMGRLFRCGLPAPGFAHSRIVRRTATSFTASAVRMRGPQLASRISCGLGYSCLYLFAAWQKTLCAATACSAPLGAARLRTKRQPIQPPWSRSYPHRSHGLRTVRETRPLAAHLSTTARIPVSSAERYYPFLAASCELPGENLGNMNNLRAPGLDPLARWTRARFPFSPSLMTSRTVER